MPERAASESDDVTTLLQAIGEGDEDAKQRLLPLVYDELRALARARMARVPPGQTLQPTALVHEAYLKLMGGREPHLRNRAHFFGTAAQVMRSILVDQARRKLRRPAHHDLSESQVDSTPQAPIDLVMRADEVIAVDAAIDRLAREHPRRARVMMLWYFGGLDHASVAELLEVSKRTVERDWRFARAWLRWDLEQHALDEK